MSTPQKITLGAISTIFDCEHKTAPIQEEGIPSIRTPNVGKGRLILDNVNRVSDETYRAWTRRAIPKTGDLILAREAPVGNVALITKGLKVCLGQRTVLIRPDRSIVDPCYLNYLLNSETLHGILLSLSNGSTVGHLNVGDIRKLPLPTLPPLPLQRKIAACITAYDDLIENNTRRIAILEQMAEEIYCEWFGRMRFPGHEQVRFQKGVPEGWKVKKIFDIAEVNAYSLKNNFQGIIEYIDIASVSQGNIDQTTVMSFKEAPGRARRVTRHGDIIWSCVRPNRRSYAIIWKPTDNLIASTGFAVLSPKGVPTSYLYQATTTDEFVGYLTNNAKGAAYPAVTSKEFENANIIIPIDSILEQFDATVKPMIEIVSNLKRKSSTLKQSRNLLLSRLLSGRLAVDEVDIHFPSSMIAEESS